MAPGLTASSSAAQRWKIEQARDKRDNPGKAGDWERRYLAVAGMPCRRCGLQGHDRAAARGKLITTADPSDADRHTGWMQVGQEKPMLEAVRRLDSLTHDMKAAADAVGNFLVDGFHFLALFSIGATTVWSAAAAFIRMVAQGHASLADILLLFIYLEIGAMLGIYFKTTRLPVRYLIYIAITALGRVLIEIVGAEHRTGMDILIIASAILLLSCSALVLRFGSHRYPSDVPTADLAGGVKH